MLVVVVADQTTVVVHHALKVVMVGVVMVECMQPAGKLTVQTPTHTPAVAAVVRDTTELAAREAPAS